MSMCFLTSRLWLTCSICDYTRHSVYLSSRWRVKNADNKKVGDFTVWKVTPWIIMNEEGELLCFYHTAFWQVKTNWCENITWPNSTGLMAQYWSAHHAWLLGKDSPPKDINVCLFPIWNRGENSFRHLLLCCFSIYMTTEDVCLVNKLTTLLEHHSIFCRARIPIDHNFMLSVTSFFNDTFYWWKSNWKSSSETCLIFVNILLRKYVFVFVQQLFVDLAIGCLGTVWLKYVNLYFSTSHSNV